jgi:hypothetical protein
MKIYIYTLEHPETGEIRYVGKTKNPIDRFRSHINSSNGKKSHKRSWIDKLKSEGLYPIMSALDEVDESEWQYWERYWIHQFKCWGFNLLNHTAGGDGLTSGNQTSFNKDSVSWNTGKGNTFTCEECKIEFKSCPASKRRFCSRKCTSKYKSRTPNLGMFKTGNKSWNNGLTGIKLKPNMNVYQYCPHTGVFIKQWITAKEASIELCINELSIGQCCRGKYKSSGGYIWSYEKKDSVESINIINKPKRL